LKNATVAQRKTEQVKVGVLQKFGLLKEGKSSLQTSSTRLLEKSVRADEALLLLNMLMCDGLLRCDGLLNMRHFVYVVSCLNIPNCKSKFHQDR
jgi:hypothetical protein